jgi:hypothetical protein
LDFRFRHFADIFCLDELLLDAQSIKSQWVEEVDRISIGIVVERGAGRVACRIG